MNALTPGTSTPGRRCGLPLLLLISFWYVPLQGQVIRGTVTEIGTAAPIPGVEVTLGDSSGLVARARTDQVGGYQLNAPGPGWFRLEASAFGYEEASGSFWVSANEDLVVDVELVIEPILLQPLEVRTEAQVPSLQAVGFYERLESGYGYFIVPEEIARRQDARYPTELLQGVPGLHVVPTNNGPLYEVIMRGGASRSFQGFPGMRRGARPRTQFCLPSITIDGTMVRRGGQGYEGEEGRWNELVQPAEIEAIEVYPGAAGLPPAVAGSDSPCGAILIWTRQ